ncbi:hypothetical protein ACW4TU_40625 [Streptomyces sp. QTS52]
MSVPHGLRPLLPLHAETLSKAQLIEAKDNLQRMRAAIPLADDEQAAVEVVSLVVV